MKKIYDKQSLEKEMLSFLDKIDNRINKKSSYEVELITQNNQEIIKILSGYKDVCKDNNYDWCLAYISCVCEMLMLFQDIYDIYMQAIPSDNK